MTCRDARNLLRQVSVDVLVIEARGDDEAKDRVARALLERAGMVFYAKQATNHWCALIRRC